MTDTDTTFCCFLGCDVSKDTVAVHDRASGKMITVPNKRAELDRLLSSYSPRTLVVCEATGGYEALLLDACMKKGLPVHRADTLKVKNFIRSFGRLAKTDAIDARGLADYGAERHAGLLLWSPLEKDREALQALVRRREDLVAMRTAEKNRAQAPKTKGVIAKTSAAMLRTINTQIERLEEEIEKLLAQSDTLRETVQVMAAMPGIGQLTAVTLLAMLPELGTLQRKQITSLAGLAPHCQDSGKMSGYRRQRGGRPEIKRALFLPALTAVRFDPDLKKAYENKIANGKNKMSAINAIMAKIITILNARIRDFMDNKDAPVKQS